MSVLAARHDDDDYDYSKGAKRWWPRVNWSDVTIRETI